MSDRDEGGRRESTGHVPSPFPISPPADTAMSLFFVSYGREKWRNGGGRGKGMACWPVSRGERNASKAPHPPSSCSLSHSSERAGRRSGEMKEESATMRRKAH